jgi:hypothetical protein
MYLRNDCTLPQHYTVSQPRRHRFESSSPWKAQNSQVYVNYRHSHHKILVFCHERKDTRGLQNPRSEGSEAVGHKNLNETYFEEGSSSELTQVKFGVCTDVEWPCSNYKSLKYGNNLSIVPKWLNTWKVKTYTDASQMIPRYRLLLDLLNLFNRRRIHLHLCNSRNLCDVQ